MQTGHKQSWSQGGAKLHQVNCETILPNCEVVLPNYHEVVLPNCEVVLSNYNEVVLPNYNEVVLPNYEVVLSNCEVVAVLVVQRRKSLKLSPNVTGRPPKRTHSRALD